MLTRRISSQINRKQTCVVYDVAVDQHLDYVQNDVIDVVIHRYDLHNGTWSMDLHYYESMMMTLALVVVLQVESVQVDGQFRFDIQESVVEPVLAENYSSYVNR